jgi:hypothetical protein
MSALDDLTTAVGECAAAASTLATQTAEVVADLAAAEADNSAQLAPITAQVQGVTTTLSGILATLPAPPAPAAVQAVDPATNLPLYSYEGTAAIDTTQWTAVTDVTASSGDTLYTFSGDTAGAAPTGAVADEWVPYTGTLNTVA